MTSLSNIYVYSIDAEGVHRIRACDTAYEDCQPTTDTGEPLFYLDGASIRQRSNTDPVGEKYFEGADEETAFYQLQTILFDLYMSESDYLFESGRDAQVAWRLIYSENA